MSTQLTTPIKNRTSLVEKIAGNYGVDPSKLLSTLKDTAFRQKDGASVSDAQMMALLVVADQYGLNPFTKEIYAFPDKQNGIVPIVGVDGWSRIINQHEQFNGMEFRYSDDTIDLDGAKSAPSWCECVIYRKDREHPTTVREYLDEVYRPPFVGKSKSGGGDYKVNGPWQSHTKRMLRHKAFMQAGRIAFGYVGIFDEDEAVRIIEGETERAVPGKPVVSMPQRKAEVVMQPVDNGESEDAADPFIAAYEQKESASD